MEELATKIAELLDISVQGAIDLYPIIREQFIAYEILFNIGDMFALTAVLTFLGIVVSLFFMVFVEEELTPRVVKVFKILIGVLVVSLVVMVVVFSLQVIVAPDVVLIKELLN